MITYGFLNHKTELESELALSSNQQESKLKRSHGNAIMKPPETGTQSDMTQADGQPLASPESNEINENTVTAFFPVAEGKLITLYILSFGLYGIYWFYKNWKLQQKSIDKKIYPVWRAIFSIFFTHSLFKRIDQQASHLEPQHKFNANTLATFFVFAIIVSNILDRLSMNTHVLDGISNNSVIITSLVLFLLSTYPLVKVQATVNRINNDMLGYLNHKYSLPNYALITVGIILWLLILSGILLQSTGFVAT